MSELEKTLLPYALATVVTASLVAGCRRSMTRDSTCAGTLAAQPPQRIGSSPSSTAISGNSQ